jgi:chromatin segregation and condensation protein Rec8/ScpA/Scc1 (kleisin family)
VRRLFSRLFGRADESRPGLTEGRRDPAITDAVFEELPARAEAKSRTPAAARPAAGGQAPSRRDADDKARREAEKARREVEKARREADEKARREAEEQARREAEEKARREAEEKARREAEEKARREAEEKARREAEEKARRDVEDRARREAEEKARREADERVRREAEEQARREAEQKARREVEERARREAEEQARREAEERARREAEEQARRAAEEQARRAAEEQARREAEEQARREAEEQARREAEEQARHEAEEQARHEAEEQARRAAEEQAVRDAEEQARRAAEEQAVRDAEEQARRAAEEQARRDAEEQARRDAEEQAALADAQARFESEQAQTSDFSARMAEAEALEGYDLAFDERSLGEPDQPADEPAQALGTPAPTEPATAADAGGTPVEPAAAAADLPAPAPAAPPRPRISVDVPGDYVPAPESEHELYRVETDGFEGPLDLLLFLIRRHALDIFDIPMSFICERYLDYLKSMEQLNIDVAAEFLAMAAELLHIKSKMLLPKPVDVDEVEEVDPRAELVRRLLEYQKYKDAADRLATLNRTGRDTFGRNPEDLPPPLEKAPLAEVGLFALIEAFDAVLARQKPELRHQVMLETASVRQRIKALIEVFVERHQVPFPELLLGGMASRIDVVVTFLAMLEMARLRLLRIYQSTEGELYLEARFDTAERAYERLAGIDTTLDGGVPPARNESP